MSLVHVVLYFHFGLLHHAQLNPVPPHLSFVHLTALIGWFTWSISVRCGMHSIVPSSLKFYFSSKFQFYPDMSAAAFRSYFMIFKSWHLFCVKEQFCLIQQCNAIKVCLKKWNQRCLNWEDLFSLKVIGNMRHLGKINISQLCKQEDKRD